MSTGSVIVKTQHNIFSHYHALAPFERLPFELLAEIFVQCISVEFREFTRAYGINRFQVFGQGWIYPHHIRAQLALVCRAWYTVLYNEPRVWKIMVLRDIAYPESVSLWIKKSTTTPLVVFIPYCRTELGSDSFFSMLHKEMWRIRYFFWDIFDEMDLSALFPLDVPTNAPMLQSLALFRPYSLSYHIFKLGDIHCPDLRTLLLSHVEFEVKSLTVGSLTNVHHLTIDQLHNFHICNSVSYLGLLEALPNLVSLSWKTYSFYSTPVSVGRPKVVLQSLESLTLKLSCEGMMISILSCLLVPSLERLVLDVTTHYDYTESMDAICDNLVQLRHLTLRNIGLESSVPALLSHLTHLETLTIEYFDNADELFIALSSPSHGSSAPCPYLKTVDISNDVNLTRKVLVKFVRQRVKSDLDDPAPGLVTCLKLSYPRYGKTRYDKRLRTQLAKTHSSTILFQ